MLASLGVGFFLALAVSLFSLKWGVLSKGGAIAATLVGTIIFGLGGWRWSAALLFFFLSSNLFSRLGKSSKFKLAEVFQKGAKRDWAQVLANGGVPAVCAILEFIRPGMIWYVGYLSSLAFSTADTWGTELGVLSKSQPLLITSGKPVPAGTSGGISGVGTLAAFTGALALSLAGSMIYPAYQLPGKLIPAIAGVGFVSSLLDSFLGATLQAQFTCSQCGRTTERLFHCQKKTSRISGWGWLNNDWVNFISSAAALALSFFLI